MELSLDAEGTKQAQVLETEYEEARSYGKHQKDKALYDILAIKNQLMMNR